MDQTIKAALDRCETLYKQLHVAQQVVVPFSVDYHWQGPDNVDPTVLATTDVNASGRLLYEPSHSIPFNQPISGGGSVSRLALLPESLATTVRGSGTAQGAVGGGDFSLSIHVMISGPLPLVGGPTASFTFQTHDLLDGDLRFQVDENVPPPIELQTPQANGRAKLTLHLGDAEVVLSSAVIGAVRVRAAGG